MVNPHSIKTIEWKLIPKLKNKEDKPEMTDYPTVQLAHRYEMDLDETQRLWAPIEHLIMIEWPEDFKRVYCIYDYGCHSEIVSEFLHYMAFLESCVNRMAAIYVHKPGTLSWAVLDDGRYDEVCHEYGFDEETFDRLR
jgi:hypothetical protein